MDNPFRPTRRQKEQEVNAKLISNSQKKCQEKNMDPDEIRFFIENPSFLNHLKAKTKSLYVYSSSVLKHMLSLFAEEAYGYGIFSEEGYLLKLYGGDKFHKWCDETGIKTGSYWAEDMVGTNAVDLGLKYSVYVEVIGEEHFCSKLKNTACYFQPITTKNRGKNHAGETVHGGIGLLCPVEDCNKVFRSLVAAVANEISLQFLWFDNCNTYLDAFDGYGYIFLDKSLGRNSIIAAGNNTFDILKIEKRDYYYEDLDSLIPNNGKNNEFWNIINERIECNDALVDIHINDRTVKVNICTMNFEDERFHMDGILIALNSIKRINKLISKYVGLNARLTFDDIIGRNSNFINAVGYAETASLSDSNILLLGESGTGKDVFAQAIHNNSSRKNNPFVAVNCAAFSKELIYSELFGYEEGAFTGAKKGGNVGKFELANHGTIFLDEIGDMSLDLQATLLRVIEQRNFMKLGSNSVTNVDVRIIAATNVNLLEKVKKKQFREDLFYRLGIVRINIPPLRERKSDIPLLSEHFIRSICKRVHKPIPVFNEEIKDFFMEYDWPGNVRELQNLLEGMINMHNENRSDSIEVEFVKKYLGVSDSVSSKTHYEDETEPLEKVSERTKTSEIEQILPYSKEKILEMLALCKNNRSQAADMLGISRSTLYRKMREYDLL